MRIYNKIIASMYLGPKNVQYLFHKFLNYKMTCLGQFWKRSLRSNNKHKIFLKYVGMKVFLKTRSVVFVCGR